MTVTNSTIDNNSAGSVQNGRGIYNSGTLMVTNSAIDDNNVASLHRQQAVAS